MSLGQGSIINNQRKEPAGAPAPPFALNSAENGLSVNAAGRIVLGQDIGAAGDPAQLLNDREIPLQGFNFFINNVLGDAILGLDQTVPQYYFGDFQLNQAGGYLWLSNAVPGTTYLSSGGLGFLMIGDVDGLGNSTVFRVDDGLQDIEAVLQNRFRVMEGGTANRFIEVDMPTGNMGFGDLDNAFNGFQLYFEPISDSIFLGDQGGVGSGVCLSMNIGAGNQGNLSFFDALGTQLLFEHTVGEDRFQIGDINTVNNGTFLEIDDRNNQFEFKNAANNSIIVMNGVAGFTGTVAAPATITVNGGIVTNVA